MKKFLFILCLIPMVLFGQTDNYNRMTIITSKYWTSDMIYNSVTDKFDFIDKTQPSTLNIEWLFLINKDTKTGMIKAGDAAYDVISYELAVKDGMEIVDFNVHNIKLNKHMKLLLTQKNGDTFIGLYDFVGRVVYYFD